MGSQVLLLPVSDRKKIAKNTFEVNFNLQGKKFDYQAGQYLEIRLPELLYPDPKGNFRLFSIASSPNNEAKPLSSGNKKHLTIAFRNSGSGFKESLLKLKTGEKVEISGPFGFFTLPKAPASPIVFIAGGIGITPFLSMIRFVTQENLDFKITLLYANKSQDSAAYLDELKRLESKNPNFDLKLKYGMFDHDFINKGIRNLKQPVFYIAGPPFMVPEIKQILTELKVEEDKIFTEEFIGY